MRRNGENANAKVISSSATTVMVLVFDSTFEVVVEVIRCPLNTLTRAIDLVPGLALVVLTSFSTDSKIVIVYGPSVAHNPTDACQFGKITQSNDSRSDTSQSFVTS